MKQLGMVVAIVLGLGFCAANLYAADDDAKPKYTLKEVMKEAHGKKLLNKVVGGDASAEDKAKLLDIYLSLLESEPKKGDKAEWHERAGAVVVATAKVVAGREGAVAELKKATNCGACHKAHK